MDEKFEIGDFIVANSVFNNTELFEIERIGSSGEFYDTRWRKLYLYNFRHATGKEIKKGKRLP